VDILSSIIPGLSGTDGYLMASSTWYSWLIVMIESTHIGN
jgi:hypothetical protein